MKINAIIGEVKKERDAFNLLHVEELNPSPGWQRPFHPAGTGGMPASLKLGDSGQIPVIHECQVLLYEWKGETWEKERPRSSSVVKIRNMFLVLIMQIQSSKTIYPDFGANIRKQVMHKEFDTTTYQVSKCSREIKQRTTIIQTA